MADIDRFKKINDTYGHQAGDAVIQTFARLLQNACHPGDLVARYGGEEFVMLCADCDNTTAARTPRRSACNSARRVRRRWMATRPRPASV